jgi:histone H4
MIEGADDPDEEELHEELHEEPDEEELDEEEPDEHEAPDEPGAIATQKITALKITAVRHKLKALKGTVTNNDMRRLARRGGVRRISTNVMAPMRATFESYLKEIVRRSVEITKCDGRKTIQGMDVVHAAKSQHAEHAVFYPGFMVPSG